ncbi:carboxylesterase/lipase family protein [Nonomuraea rhizosphaerae]|uniref:carboxylesterase/lipase family protein n=1 Tax=Nonomuraea rhizosphaerae TaxID=2665663 RepID=UPI001C5F3CF1|nr:carboxylesterase family protein [Nonomuraea rhizosphaerae]
MSSRQRCARAFAAFLAAALATVSTGAATACAASGRTPAVATTGGATVRTDAGSIRGRITGDQRLFRGIPYAAPPVGALRWASPEPVHPWTGTRQATEAAPRCAQNAEQGAASDAEDCLYLNVTTPARTDARHPLPVLVWVHGGGFFGGAGSDYDARRLAVRGRAIVVTVNYRLGVFGFFAHPALGRDGGDFGLEDQMAALRWTRRNAAAFGGDPRNVTLSGQSAGAFSTCALLTAPAAKGLFDKAIVQSGSCSVNYPKNGLAPGLPPYTPLMPREFAETFGKQSAAALGCATAADVLACLRKTPVNKLLPMTQRFAFPAYGTKVLPRRPADVLSGGDARPVPMIVGHNRDEMRLYVSAAQAQQPIDAARYRELLQDTFGADATRAERAYPASDAVAPALAWANVLTDRGWACPTRDDERTLARRAPVYAYEFADRDAPSVTPPTEGFPMGAAHGSELPYLWTPGRFTAAQQKLSDDMIRYWTAFARTGDPNQKGLPAWPRFDGRNGRTQSLAPGPHGIRSVDLTSARHCDLWAKTS